MTEIFTNYSSVARPVVDHRETVTVSISFVLNKIDALVRLIFVYLSSLSYLRLHITISAPYVWRHRDSFDVVNYLTGYEDRDVDDNRMDEYGRSKFNTSKTNITLRP